MHLLGLVDNDEDLYRRISAKSDHYYVCNGEYIIDQAAFQDKGQQPSVDRAKLKKSDPHLAQRNSTDGVICIKVEDVRKIGTVVTEDHGRLVKRHSVDVIAKPSRKNPAHAIITVSPEFFGEPHEKKRTFRKLRMALAKLANDGGAFILEPKLEGS